MNGIKHINMDYEKEYKEALSRAKRLRDSKYQTMNAKRVAEEIFPVLAESEDEKIRKWLYNMVENLGYPADEAAEKELEEMQPLALAWLKKQKEPKQECGEKGIKGPQEIGDWRGDEGVCKKQKEQKVDIDKLRRDIYQSGYNDGYQHGKEDAQKEQKPAVEQQSGTFNSYDMAKTYAEGQYYVMKHPEKFCLCKPAEWSEFDRGVLEDAICATDLLGNDESFNKSNPNLAKAFRVAKDWLESLPERFVLQPKQEWSEEDEKELDCIINILDRLGFEEFCKSSRDQDIEEERFYYKEIQFLKRLKSLRPQSKDETYEEKDEAFKLGKHQLAIVFMNYLDENRPEGKMSLSNTECEDIDKAFKENDWTKIMRYYEKYRPSWKPSEEQMCYLKKVYESYDFCDGERDALEALYNDLKKLM